MENTNQEKDNDENYEPNYINQDTQYEKLFYAGFLLVYGTFAIIIDDLFIPGRRGRADFHFQGIPLWIMYIAMMIGVAHSISFLVDHSDKRNNEQKYKTFQTYSKYIGWSLVTIAAIMQLIIYKENT
jgi:hypothetical protein